MHELPGSNGRVDFKWPATSLPIMWTSESFWSSTVDLLAEWSVYPVGAIPGRRQLCLAWAPLFGLLSLEAVAARKVPMNRSLRVASPRICRRTARRLTHSRRL